MVHGAALNDRTRTQLFSIARQMIVKGVSRQRFAYDDCEGVVTTKGESARLGSVSGVHFTAIVESEMFTTKVSYIVPTGELEDLDKAKWYELYPHWDDGPSLN